LAYFENDREEYHITYHNAIWASLSNGLAGIPVWWQYTHLNDQDWQQLQHLSGFVSDIDFANLPYQPVKATADGTDVYVMDAGDHAFGWARSYQESTISGVQIQIEKPQSGEFEIEWFNTWTGETIKTDKITAENGVLEIKVPEMNPANPDVAFKISAN